MKRVRMGALGIALGIAAVSSTAAAQGVGGAQFVIGAGGSFALGEFADMVNTGPHALAGVQFGFPTFPVALRVDGAFTRFSTDVDDLNAQVISGTLNGVFNFKVAPTSKIRPYLIGGVGIYNTKATGDAAPANAESVTDFGINAGAGFNYSASPKVDLFLEGRFHNVFADGNSQNVAPVTVGVRIG